MNPRPMDDTVEALLRLRQAAQEWSTRADLTRAEQAMARSVEIQATKLAAARTASGEELDTISLIACHLYTVVLGGKKPNPKDCPFGLCDKSSC